MKRAIKHKVFRTLLGVSFIFLFTGLPDADAADSKPPEEPTPVTAESKSSAESLPSIPKPDLKISINIPTYTMKVFENGKLVKEYSVAVGQPKYPSPVGSYNIERIEWNPWWYPPDSPWAENAEVTPPGPKNPLGPVKMVMETDLRVHGTNKDYSVGRPASHGCFRMHNKEARELAWYLQSRSSVKNDEALLEKYKKNPTSTFVVKLDYPVPVDITYENVFVTPETIEIHPDLYWKIHKIPDQIVKATAAAGLDPKVYDEKKLSKIKRTWKTQTIPTVDLLPEIGLQNLSPEQVVQQ